MLKDKMVYNYQILDKNCAEAVILAANEVYEIGLDPAAVKLFIGFGGGMGCGSTCGALTGAISVLSHLYGDLPKDDFRPMCKAFVEAFEAKLGSLDCDPISAKYKTPADRCTKTMALTGELLDAFIKKMNGESEVPEGEGCTLTDDQIKRVKGLGCLQNKGTNKFNVRVITRNGHITTDEMQAVKDAAVRYGDGYVNLTTRLTMEVSGVDYNDIEAFIAMIEKAGLSVGGTGSKVRPVVSCKGTTCQYGLYDTFALSETIHHRFYEKYHDVSLPHKFKIATGGCPNNCVKPSLNDVGVIGAKMPLYDETKCRGCKVCQIEASCPIGAAKMVDGKLVIDREACNNCGRCVAKCPFHCADEGQYGFKICVGGRWGKKVAYGRQLDKFFTSEEEVLDTIDKVILFFRSEGISGERLADTINRVGFEKAQEMILSNELLEKKAEILGINVVGGASC